MSVLIPLLLATLGCGTTRQYEATEQLVVSDAVDRSISAIDFRPLSGRKVYLDSSYIRSQRNEGIVNAAYVTSALRQQIVGAGCLIQDSSGDADVVIEARLGTLGMDDYRVTFGIPENNAISSAASLIPGTTNLPNLPEIAIAKRESREGAAKVAAFAYDRESRQPIWQSGVNHSMANARDTWVFGVGPVQSGSVRKETKVAGTRFRLPRSHSHAENGHSFERPPVDYTAAMTFQQGWPMLDPDDPAAKMIGSDPPDAQIAKDAGDPTEDETEPIAR